MMTYIVLRPFKDISGYKKAGDTIQLDAARAAKLRRYGLIGNRYEAQQIMSAVPEVPEVQKAVKKTKKK